MRLICKYKRQPGYKAKGGRVGGFSVASGIRVDGVLQGVLNMALVDRHMYMYMYM